MLQPGSRIDPYEILGSLGAGGPASVRATHRTRALRRGLDEARMEMGC